MLLANGVRAGAGPYRYLGGAGVLNVDRAAWAGPALLQGFYCGEATVVSGVSQANLSGRPSGTRPPIAWSMAIKGGGMSSYRRASLGLSATGSGALGYGIAGTASLSLEASAIGQLIAGAVGTATIGLTASGAVTATIGTTGAATIGLSGAASIGALGWMEGQSTLGMDGSMVSYAIGHMVGSTEETGVLTPGSIASAVWQTVAAEQNTAGTMGSKLNTASSGGVDLDALAAAVWAYTVRTLTDATQPARLQDVWQRLGLDPANPQTTTANSISAGGVQQSITEAAGTVTVTRLP